MVGSQTKAEWICQMDKDLQSYFSETRAYVFFNRTKEHDWRINSSASALEAIANCVWEDTYYTEHPLTVTGYLQATNYGVFPNPFTNEINIETITLVGEKRDGHINIYELTGKKVGDYPLDKKLTIDKTLSKGIYIMELITDGSSQRFKIIKQ